MLLEFPSIAKPGLVQPAAEDQVAAVFESALVALPPSSDASAAIA